MAGLSIYEKRILKQYAIYWPPDADSFDAFGRPQSATPSLIQVRWEDTNEEFIDSMGTRRVSSAKVLVGKDVAVGGRMQLISPVIDPLPDLPDLPDADAMGGHMQLTAPDTDPLPDSPDAAAMEILKVSKVPSRNGRRVMRTVFL